MVSPCKVLLVSPRFLDRSIFDLKEACEAAGARYPLPPLGLITVAALLPREWECRLVNRNTEELREADIDWADMVMIGGMLPQRPDAHKIIALVHSRHKPVVIGGPDVSSSPEAYEAADFRVLGEAEEIIHDFVAAWDAGERQGIFEAAKFSVDVTQTPVPRYELLTRTHYAAFSVQFARGCPFKCEFCDIIELYGRKPRVKTIEQVLTELDALYESGWRGHVEFVDDNFIGNKKAVKILLPHLIAWQKERGYPFNFATEASLNLADDDELLGLMREANFYLVFMGIESPDPDTLVSMQKKQNTRRSLADSVHKVYRAGMMVNAGFIVGFDTERSGMADVMIDCIEATSIPFCVVGLLFALPMTQLTRRLTQEGRMYPMEYVTERSGDQCTNSLNFETLRPRRDVLSDYRNVLENIYSPPAFFERVRHLVSVLDRPRLDRSKRKDPPRPQLFGIPRADLLILWRLILRLLTRGPTACWHFAKVFRECAKNNPRALEHVVFYALMFLHLGRFTRNVVKEVDRQIADIDSGRWQSPLAGRAAPLIAAPATAQLPEPARAA
jgi:hypothetical protein